MFGFTVKDHSQDHTVCAAVSLLILNTANSIEALTDTHLVCDHHPEGGYFSLELPQVRAGDEDEEKAELLLKAMELGLYGVQQNYSNFITIKEEIA